MKKRISLTGLIILMTITGASACSVPVFRYALERWVVDPYPVYLMHDGVNTAKVAEAEAYLEDYEDIGAVYVYHVNLSDPKVREAAKKRSLPVDEPLPRMVVTLPERHPIHHIIMDTEITKTNVDVLVDSPVRREIARRIIAGDSAVWLLLESGDKTKDDAAAKLIQEQIDAMAEELELPAIAPQDMRFVSVDPNMLKISFSMMRLSRKDPNEKLLLEMLLNSEPDLVEYSDEPIVFPIFGRGRALFALVGEGINEDNIAQTCYFLTGSCSCEVKAYNPGMDLLIAIDWYEYIDNLIGFNEDLPPLTGYSQFIPTREPTNTVTKTEKPVVKTGNPLLRNLIILLVFLIILMVIFAKIILVKMK